MTSLPIHIISLYFLCEAFKTLPSDEESSNKTAIRFILFITAASITESVGYLGTYSWIIPITIILFLSLITDAFYAFKRYRNR